MRLLLRQPRKRLLQSVVNRVWRHHTVTRRLSRSRPSAGHFAYVYCGYWRCRVVVPFAVTLARPLVDDVVIRFGTVVTVSILS
jgi:hypothetical protein